MGIKVGSFLKGHLLSQSKYANELIHRARLTDDKVVDTHIELHVKFSTSNGVPLNDLTLYCELIGYLVYLIVISQEISYVVHVVS